MPADTATALPISVELLPELPKSAPLIVVDNGTMQRIANLEAEAATVAISDAQTAEDAAAILRSAAKLQKEIDAIRLQVKRPFMDMEKLIDGAAKAPLATLEAIGRNLRPRLAKWQAHCEQLAREEERKRQEEIARAEAARKEAEARAAKAEAERQAALAAAQAAPNDEVVEFDEFAVVMSDTDAEKAQREAEEIARKSAQLQQTRAVVAPAKPTGISFRKVLKFEVTDVNKLPTHLLTITPNDAAIRAQFLTGWKDGDPVPTHPGIRFVVDTTTAVSTRR